MKNVLIADQDYTHEVVPVEARQSAIQVLSIWLGFILVVGIMAVGGALAGELTRSEFITATIVGNLVLAVLAGIVGYIGAKTGKAFNQLLDNAFIGIGRNIANLYVPIVLVAWYAIEAALFGSFVAQALHLSAFIQGIFTVVAMLFFSASTYIGFKGMKWVSYFMVPIIFVFGAYAVLAMIGKSDLHFGFGTPITLSAGIWAVISSWIMGVLTTLPDLTRFCRKASYGALIGAGGILVANSFNIIIGGYAASLTSQSDPALILTSLGFVVISLLFSLSNIWTTNDGNMYAASLNLSSSIPLSRKNCVLLLTAISIVLTLLHPERLSFIFSFLGFMGNTAPALAGVVYTSSFFGLRHNLKPNFWMPWVAWIVGSYVSYITPGLWSFVTGLIVAVVLTYFGLKIGNKK